MKKSNSNSSIIIAQVIGWVVMFAMPAITNISMMGDYAKLSMAIRMSLIAVGPLCTLYFLNYFLLVPKLLYAQNGKEKIWFYVTNFVIVLAWHLGRYAISRSQMPSGPHNAFTPPSFHTMMLVHMLSSIGVDALVIAIAAGIKKIVISNKLLISFEQERRNAAEAELSWLKNQLNPHFLFNTLNNISSLTQIDADKAQESICQLSDLLRYALYDSEQEYVPIEGEIDFMYNYVRLMQLRCNKLATVECNFERPDKPVQIAPLLFISLIENAFKHGVNARKESFVRIDMHLDGHDLVFRSENSLFEKQTSDHIGSGIGLENMKKRLNLIYPGRYEYLAEGRGDRYISEVRLKNIA